MGSFINDTHIYGMDDVPAIILASLSKTDKRSWLNRCCYRWLSLLHHVNDITSGDSLYYWHY
ncbi:hypothetical protein J4727_18815 [Providencia rettgeri]|uniref:Uncharacterized protein n=1 Tax=Providencia rettgeri TaxID=587 RepID=A0A939NBI0_PRORE|nr:hypothetical protein [Providencia rettgeri]